MNKRGFIVGGAIVTLLVVAVLVAASTSNGLPAQNGKDVIKSEAEEQRSVSISREAAQGESQAQASTPMLTPTLTPTPSPTPSPSPTPILAGCDYRGGDFQTFTPNENRIREMSQNPPTRAEFLNLHGLTTEMVQDFVPEPAMWEPAMFVVELDESLYGNFCLELQPGYVYTVSLIDGRVEPFWGGDPNLTKVAVQWGFTARYLPLYLGKEYGLGGWLSIQDPHELLVREHRFGRYLRNPEMAQVRDDVPFFNRVGPYYVGTGNIDTDWVPPALTAFVPRDYRDAAAMLGGLARENEWTVGDNGVWVWRYSEKVPGSGTYCPAIDPCWQTVYVPLASDGYVEIWHNGGPTRFYAEDNVELSDGAHNVDEFSYHPFPDL